MYTNNVVAFKTLYRIVFLSTTHCAVRNEL
jgi:hypothetical protein